jgi:hypothetical protein
MGNCNAELSRELATSDLVPPISWVERTFFSFSYQYATLNQGKGSVFTAYTITGRIEKTNKKGHKTGTTRTEQ